MPLFSIIIPTRNRALLLQECVRSVLDQSFGDFELVIIDDGSKDNTRDIIEAFNDPRINYHYQAHKERSTARNHGLEKATGSYICFIDDDDTILPVHLETFYNVINDSSYNKEILRIGYGISRGNKTGPLYSKAEHKNPVHFALNYMCGVWSLCIPEEYVKELRFPEEFPHWQDTYFILRLFAHHELRQLQKKTYLYRIHDQMGSLLVKSESQLKERANINVAAITDYKNRFYVEIQNKTRKDVFDFLAAEKYAMYAVLAKQNNFDDLSKELMKCSRSYKTSFRLWRYYINYFTS